MEGLRLNDEREKRFMTLWGAAFMAYAIAAPK